MTNRFVLALITLVREIIIIVSLIGVVIITDKGRALIFSGCPSQDGVAAA